MFIAAKDGDKAGVKAMLEAGMRVDVAVMPADGGMTPLFLAAMAGHEDVVALLLRAGANVNKVVTGGQTPLFGEAANKHEAVVAILLEKGAEVDRADSTGHTALLFAAHAGHVAVFTLLIRAGADVDSASDDGRTPLFKAAEIGHEALVRTLMDAGADPRRVRNEHAVSDGTTQWSYGCCGVVAVSNNELRCCAIHGTHSTLMEFGCLQAKLLHMRLENPIPAIVPRRL
jgi:ankyrin repeat protein